MTLRDAVSYAQGLAVGAGQRLERAIARDAWDGQREVRVRATDACCSDDLLETHERFYGGKHAGQWSNWHACGLSLVDVLALDWELA